MCYGASFIGTGLGMGITYDHYTETNTSRSFAQRAVGYNSIIPLTESTMIKDYHKAPVDLRETVKSDSVKWPHKFVEIDNKPYPIDSTEGQLYLMNLKQHDKRRYNALKALGTNSDFT